MNEHASALGKLAAGVSKKYDDKELALRTRRLLKAAARSRKNQAALKARDVRVAKHQEKRLLKKTSTHE